MTVSPSPDTITIFGNSVDTYIHSITAGFPLGQKLRVDLLSCDSLFLLNSPLDVPQRECGRECKDRGGRDFYSGNQPSPAPPGMEHTHTQDTSKPGRSIEGSDWRGTSQPLVYALEMHGQRRWLHQFSSQCPKSHDV